MNIIFDEKDLAKLNTEGMEKLAAVMNENQSHTGRDKEKIDEKRT